MIIYIHVDYTIQYIVGDYQNPLYIGDIHLFFWVHAGLVDIACDIADLSIGGSWFSKFSFLYTYWSTGTTGWKQLGMNFMVYFDLLYSQYFNHRSRFGVNIDTMHIRFHDLGDLRYSVAPGAAAAADERRTLGRCGKSNGFPSPSCGCPFLGSRWSRVKWKPWSIRRWSIPSQKARYGGFPVK